MPAREHDVSGRTNRCAQRRIVRLSLKIDIKNGQIARARGGLSARARPRYVAVFGMG